MNNGPKIEVSAYALAQLLHALNSGGPEIREMQVTRNLPGTISEGNPINVLTKEFNDWAEARKDKNRE